MLLIVRTCELVCCWGWVWRELRVWRLRPTSLRGAAAEEAETRHWLSTEAVCCTLSSVLGCQHGYLSNILLKLNMDKLLYVYFSTHNIMNVKVKSCLT